VNLQNFKVSKLSFSDHIDQNRNLPGLYCPQLFDSEFHVSCHQFSLVLQLHTHETFIINHFPSIRVIAWHLPVQLALHYNFYMKSDAIKIGQLEKSRYSAYVVTTA
jgi:hypothetical protein